MIFVHVCLFLAYYKKLEATFSHTFFNSASLLLDPHTDTYTVSFAASFNFLDSWLLKHFAPS